MKCFSNTYEDLNEACSLEDISQIERNIGHVMPVDLKELYLAHNGQGNNSKGIFKILSGYDKYSRPIFLSSNDFCELYLELCKKEYLKEIFLEHYVPFAVDNIKNPDDVLCYDIKTGKILLLWVMYYDCFTPIDWQLSRIEQADNLDEFFTKQISYYGI